MRIISGSIRGMKLEAPAGLKTRPTTDRVKENLFNLIQFEIEGTRVLDLFCGSAGLGIEALSRGAQSLTYVEKDKESFFIAGRNIEKSGFSNESKSIQMRVEDFLSSRYDENTFDLVFADPPYGKELCILTLKLLHEGNWVAENGLVVLEHGKFENLPVEVGHFSQIQKKVYGQTSISLYRRTSL